LHEGGTYLPVLGVASEQHRILRLADVAFVVLLDLLGALLGLYPIILGEGALVAGTAGVGQEVRADRLDGALCGMVLGDLADGLEVLLGSPALGEGGEGQSRNHGFFCGRLG